MIVAMCARSDTDTALTNTMAEANNQTNTEKQHGPVICFSLRGAATSTTELTQKFTMKTHIRIPIPTACLTPMNDGSALSAKSHMTIWYLAG